MEGGVSRDRERRGKWSGLNHESNREREREKAGFDGGATASLLYARKTHIGI